jgi:hypothetical protein
MDSEQGIEQMKHLSWKYRRRRTPQEMREFRAAQSRRIAKRWEQVHAAQSDEPVRQTRTNRITIEDSHRMRLVFLLARQETPRGWSRAEVVENGKPVSGRWGIRKLATALAKLLQ